MTDDPYAERELRAALGTLLADEPPAPPVGDDVARGRARQRRRRARAGAVAGVAAVAIGAVALAGLLRPVGGTTPVGGSPSPSASTDQVSAVTAELERLGFTVTASTQRTEPVLGVRSESDPVVGVRTETEYAVRPSAAAPGSTSAELTVRTWQPADAPGERSALPGAVMNGCDGTTCTAASSDGQFCQGGTCWGQWSATTTAAYASQVPGSLVVFLADGERALEGVATPESCPTCSTIGRSEQAFLTSAQLRSVLLAAAGADATPDPVPSGSAEVVRACRDADVKLIPATDPEQELFERSVVLEVHARNPQVRCSVTGHATVLVRGAGGDVLPFDVVPVPATDGSAATPSIVVTQASTPAAVLTVRQGRCTAEAPVPAAALLVTLPGGVGRTTVELPSGLAPVSCPGGSPESRTLTVSAFSAP